MKKNVKIYCKKQKQKQKKTSSLPDESDCEFFFFLNEIEPKKKLKKET